MVVWNLRYYLYAKAYQKEPEAMLAADEDLWPGGKMTGFILWINTAWQGFSAENGFKDSREAQLGISNCQTEFDKWLYDNYTNILKPLR